MSEFSANASERLDVQVINLNGYLDAHTAPQLESTFSELIGNNKYKIVVNFQELKYISSAGLGVFMAFIEKIRDNKGDIKLVEMKPNVFNIFDLLGFPLLYEIYEKESDAINRFQNPKE